MISKFKLLTCALLISSLAFAQINPFGLPPAPTTTKEFRYTNPITRDSALAMRDHFIIKVDKKWYCVGTSEPVWTGPNPGVRLLVSEDMLNWKQHSFLIDAKKLPPDCPYNGRFWAPEIHFIKDKILPDCKQRKSYS